jgi:four helix bundle protein
MSRGQKEGKYMLDKRIGHENDILLHKADEYVKLIYVITKTFPKDEIFGLTSQIRRAALSIVLNIVEGYARGSKKDNSRFLEFSYGSLKETKYLVYFSFYLQYINMIDYEKAMNLAEEIGKLLWKKIQYLKQ